ncbi:septal ring lytic transglycosylase RlpA family protein [Exilibacterium tricleocarpae]|uniref:Endolytic peptidoglycan transglycosylase RlpA n=1 Tax=Exilibacterium tricleocarpae TaxID=2591008 RepID=A0A545STL8_9GAMM|nr:septal ring lytic transglycosylase RlpA family protein [Exilibacterium tricleocarpae]
MPRAIRLLALAGVLALSGCISAPLQVPKPEPKDGGPPQPVDVSGVKDAVPRVERRTRAGNSSPYTVLGNTYHVLKSSHGFRQTGIASWYGTKFHGRTTANGETYDMYAMTAAHKSLPIPSYVQVKNLENGRSVVVRVNDRGPFHGDRIIDLTYAAAAKLGFVDQGIAKVEVVALEADPQLAGSAAAIPSDAVRQPFLQAGAFGSQSAALALRQRLTKLTALPVTVKRGATGDSLYRVHIGPITDSGYMRKLKTRLQQQQRVSAHVVYE